MALPRPEIEQEQRKEREQQVGSEGGRQVSRDSLVEGAKSERERCIDIRERERILTTARTVLPEETGWPERD